MERHVLIDHVRRPFSAILEKNLRKGKVRDDKTWILSLSQYHDDQSIALNAIIFPVPTLTRARQEAPTTGAPSQSGDLSSPLPRRKLLPPRRILKQQKGINRMYKNVLCETKKNEKCFFASFLLLVEIGLVQSSRLPIPPPSRILNLLR